MTETTVSTKGAVVIPAPIRKKLGILPGRKVAVTEIDGKVQIIPLSDDPMISLRGCLNTAKSVGELLQETRNFDIDHEKYLSKTD